MKVLKFVIFALLTILLVSCEITRKLEFYGKSIVVDNPEQTDVLKGSSITLEGEYTGMMYAYDGMLVFESEKHPDGWLYLYDVETGKRINAIGKKGQGPNEFAGLHFFGDFEKDSNGICLWVNEDPRRNNIVLLNTQGYRVKEISTLKFKSTNWYGIGGFHILNDSLLLAHVSPERIFENKVSVSGYHVFNYKSGETVKKYETFSEYETGEVVGLFSPDMYLSSYSVIKPHKTKLATVIYYLKRINILDIESGKQISIATKDAPDLNYLSSGKPVEMYYGMNQCDEHHIYVMEYANWEPNGIINVFDWNGNFVRILRVDEGYVSMALDPIRKILYTKNDAEEVMAYDVNYLYK